MLNSRKLQSPEDRAQVAGEAMAVVNEHPNPEVRKLYAAQVATHVGIPAHDLVEIAARRQKAPSIRVQPVRRVGASENAEFVGLAMLLQRWDSIATCLIEELFTDDVIRRAFLAIAEAAGDVETALSLADPEAREVIERAAVSDVEADPVTEARNLIAAATRRRLMTSINVADPEQLLAIRDVRLWLEELDTPGGAEAATDALLDWLTMGDGEVE